MIDTLSNVLHLLATSVWIGGALFIHFVLQPSLASIDPQQAGKLFGAVAKRFTLAAWSSIIVMLITGLYKTPGSMLFDPSSEIGLVLLIKHVFILAVIVIGLLIAFAVVPRIQAATPQAGEKPSDEFISQQKRLKFMSGTNTVFAMIILILASMLE